MTLYSHTESNIRKTWLYLAGFLLLVIAFGWLISAASGSQIILWLAVLLSIVMSVGSYWYSDKLVLAMTNAKSLKKEDNPELYRIVENLAITAGLPIPRIFVIEDKQPNAFATGRDPQHAVVAVTKGLLERLERAELEGVLAHELSHIGNRDMLLSTLVVVLVGFVVLLSDLFFRMSYMGRGGGAREGQRRAVFMLIGLVAVIVAPLIAQLIKFAISRKRELLADASGALLTRYPEGLARALDKIARDPSQLRTANDATAHLYIVNPFRGKEATAWIHKLFMTHPPMEERIAALRGIQV